MMIEAEYEEQDSQRMRDSNRAGSVRARPSAQGSALIEELDPMAEWQTEMRQMIVGSYDNVVALAHMLTGSREDGETLTRTALLAVFSTGRAPADMTDAELAVRREIIVTAAARPPAPAAHATGGDAGDTLADLAPRERAVIVCRYLEGLSTEDTAEMLGISVTAARADVADGVKYLNSMLGTNDPLTGPLAVATPSAGAGANGDA